MSQQLDTTFKQTFVKQEDIMHLLKTNFNGTFHLEKQDSVCGTESK